MKCPETVREDDFLELEIINKKLLSMSSNEVEVFFLPSSLSLCLSLSLLLVHACVCMRVRVSLCV